jgi:hypothetical protein
LLSHAKAFITQRLPGRVNTFLKGCGLQPFFQRAPGAHVRIQIGFSPFPICKGAAGDRMYVTRHGGSGLRGSHQLGKTPIRPLPSRTFPIFIFVIASAMTVARENT